jgi:hypothetical protein
MDNLPVTDAAFGLAAAGMMADDRRAAALNAPDDARHIPSAAPPLQRLRLERLVGAAFRFLEYAGSSYFGLGGAPDGGGQHWSPHT